MKLVIIILCFSLNYVFAYNFKTTLSDIGYSSGVVSNTKVNTQTVYFNLPENSLIKGGKLNLKINRAPFLTESSHIKIVTNGEVLGFITKHDAVIPIKKELLRGGKFRVDFEFYADFASGKICESSPVFKGLLSIDKTSFLDIDLAYRPKTINDFLITLPKETILTLKERSLTQREFVFITFLKKYLTNTGRKLSFNYDLNKETTFFLGNGTEISNYYLGFNNKEKSFEFAIKRFYTKNFSFLAFNSDLFGEQVNVLSLFSNAFNVRAVKSFNELKVNKKESLTPIFEKVSSQMWRLHYSNSDLLTASVIESIDLSIMALSDKKRHNIFLSIYKEDKLVKVIELGSMSDAGIFHVTIPKGLSSKDSNIYIKASVKGSFATQGECVSSGAGINLSILPDTKVNFSDFSNRKSFMNFARSSVGEYNVHIPSEWLSNLDFGIDHVLKLINSVSMNSEHINFYFYESSPNLAEKNNFVISSSDLDFEGPHKLNANKYNVNYIEIAKLNEQDIFHYQISKGLRTSKFKYLPIDSKDLTYFDSSRVLYTVNSKTDKTFKVEYSNPVSVMAILRKYKFYIFGLLWVLLTFLFIRFAKRRK